MALRKSALAGNGPPMLACFAAPGKPVNSAGHHHRNHETRVNNALGVDQRVDVDPANRAYRHAGSLRDSHGRVADPGYDRPLATPSADTAGLSPRRHAPPELPIQPRSAPTNGPP